MHAMPGTHERRDPWRAWRSLYSHDLVACAQSLPGSAERSALRRSWEPSGGMAAKASSGIARSIVNPVYSVVRSNVLSKPPLTPSWDGLE